MALTHDTVSSAQTAAKRIREINATIYQELTAGLVEAYNTFWRNAQGAAPQEVADAMGIDAARCFQMHMALTTVLAQLCQMDEIPLGVPDRKSVV